MSRATTWAYTKTETFAILGYFQLIIYLISLIYHFWWPLYALNDNNPPPFRVYNPFPLLRFIIFNPFHASMPMFLGFELTASTTHLYYRSYPLMSLPNWIKQVYPNNWRSSTHKIIHYTHICDTLKAMCPYLFISPMRS